MTEPKTSWLDQNYITLFQEFHNLMKKRIRDVLLVSSLYDLYLFEEDGRLYELIRNEYQGLQLTHAPEITRTSSVKEALDILEKEEKKFDLVITTLHTENIPAIEFAKSIKRINPDIPIVLLSLDNLEIKNLLNRPDISVFEKIFIWTGDYRLILGIIKSLEDKMNIENDTKLIGVQCIILIEDDIRSYSTFLPVIYTEIIKQSRRLISEGINLYHKSLRMRARPKIILCTSYEEAMHYFNKYQEYVLGVISDVEFSKDGVHNKDAGFIFAEEVRKHYTDIPILLQSSDPTNKEKAENYKLSFLLKQSPVFLHELREFITNNFGFGDFVFKTPDGKEVGRATDLLSLEKVLKDIPAESIRYHGERNHFSNWLKARTEFWLADKLRPQKVEDYNSIEDLRRYLIAALKQYRKVRTRGIITDFNKATYDPKLHFARIGGGSLGGKARGLSFLNTLINNFGITNKFPGVIIDVPPSVVIGTDAFDQFLDENNLRGFALKSDDYEETKRRFFNAEKFPPDIVASLRDFLELVKFPLSVRSSSLLEDSQYHPFAGVYETYMIPNNHPNIENRLKDLLNAIKLVYASTFSPNAKNYFKITSYRLEEEKMAVIIQRMVGTVHKNRFYPDFSGVAKSYNFYPLPPMTAKDGVVLVALGLGITIVEGGNCVRFCPKYPTKLIQFYNPKEAISNNQKYFYALDLESEYNDSSYKYIEEYTKLYDIHSAESDGTLHFVGSTYSHENHAIYDGISRPGSRLVTFAPILKNNLFPLPSILELLLNLGSSGMGTPVEIEFAVRMSVPKGEPKEFGVLQMRPVVISEDSLDQIVNNFDKKQLICLSNEILGNGTIDYIKDIVFVDIHKFERSKTREIALEVSQFNSKLLDENKPYLLIGLGRWGTLDPWLGIPVSWANISGAKVIVEAGMKDMDVEPSQGSHFFHNITSFMIHYFTINSKIKDNFIDWEWLLSLPPIEEKKYVKHIRLDNPIIVKMNTHQKLGVIIKPKPN
ncbi:MAG: histidine kinase [Ignavibacteria bacterium]|nr:histidine kinase [Ignavibacteria bacterium]